MALAVAAPPRKKVVAYVPNWIDLKTFAEPLPYAKLTHINIAFENPLNELGELSFHPENEILIQKARAHGVKICVSLGGGAAAGDKVLRDRYFSLIREEKRKSFVADLADYVVKHHFDGLDLDLEGPSINEDYGPFVEALAAALKTRGKLLTAALSQGYGGEKVPDSVFPLLDFLNIMAYDATGPWEADSAGQHSSYEFAQSNVTYWLKRGLPRSKAVLGVPFYGYGFGGAYQKRDYAYAEILEKHPEAHDRDRVGKTIWYNGIPTLQAKARWVLQEDLGGIMIWSLDADAPGPKSLLDAIHQALHRPRRD